MTWKVRADCTYTTAANKTAAQSAAQAAIDSYSVTPVAERFAAGLVSQSTTRFTISVDVADEAQAIALGSALNDGILSGKARATTLLTYHRAG